MATNAVARFHVCRSSSNGNGLRTAYASASATRKVPIGTIHAPFAPNDMWTFVCLLRAAGDRLEFEAHSDAELPPRRKHRWVVHRIVLVAAVAIAIVEIRAAKMAGLTGVLQVSGRSFGR